MAVAFTVISQISFCYVCCIDYRLPGKQNSEIFVICAEIEEEISELDDDEKKMFLEDLGLTESVLHIW